MKAIVAMSENCVIGAHGSIPWYLPEDFRFFKRMTLGYPIVMGRKTYESLGKPLPGRKNILLTRQFLTLPQEVLSIHSVEELLKLEIPLEETFVIGGAEIYRLLLPKCDTLFVTRVHRNISGDTFFPPFEEEFQKHSCLLEAEEFTIYEYRRRENHLTI